MANLKQPRASIACSRNRDPDYLLLAAEGVEGLAAVGLFDALLCAAKDQDNGGVFELPSIVVSAMVGVEIKTYSKLIQKLIKLGWLVRGKSGGESITVRSYAKWNKPDQRGGPRPGAGRPSRIGNQKEIKPESNDIQTETAPLPLPLPSPLTTYPPPKASETAKPRKPHWADPVAQTLTRTLQMPSKPMYTYLGNLAHKFTRQAVLTALAKTDGETFANWEHVKGWLYKVAESASRQPVEPEPYYDPIN